MTLARHFSAPVHTVQHYIQHILEILSSCAPTSHTLNASMIQAYPAAGIKVIQKVIDRDKLFTSGILPVTVTSPMWASSYSFTGTIPKLISL